MDDIDRRIINHLQGEFPVSERPYRDAGRKLGCSESELITRIRCMLDDGLLTRFGPLFHAEKMGGALSLCALKVPDERFDKVTDIVNSFPEVAHNYQREHEMNMWFVLATETPEQLEETLHRIEAYTGLEVYNFPKQAEYYVGLNLQV
ncbi:Heme d1 biosynthesis protein NirG [hydrothermal vent metagenome]|uniref:siroheme decarboxylase n=1 Tax=hydrothermal vent metagenome TaxID=652676 RepID=A0A3B0YA87_9ZZZZ